MTTPHWADPFSPEGLREAVARVLTGTNYRLFFEGVTRTKLIDAYRRLVVLSRLYADDDERWRTYITELLADPAEGGLRRWLLGLTNKTAENLGVRVPDYPELFSQLMVDLEQWPPELEPRETALLLWCGAATLTIRGSQKARIGKALERSVARAALAVIGLQQGEHFWLDIGADQEVARQTDAEVATPRGRMRMEVGLIGVGNPEVIGDKVGRMDRNGVILFDVLPARSTMWQTAEQKGVKLIQMRNNHPVEELRVHLATLGVSVQSQPITVEEVQQRTLAMDLDHFEHASSDSTN